MITQAEVSAFLLAMAKAIPTFAPDFNQPDFMAIWHANLSGFTLDQLRGAYRVMVKTDKTFPSVARIAEVIGAANRETFDELIRLVGTHGGYRPPEVSYRMAMMINRLGGWQEICTWSSDELPFRRKDFEEAQSAVEMIIAQADPLTLPVITLTGGHSSTQSCPSGKTRTLLLEAPPPPPVAPPEDKAAFWDSVRAFFLPMKLYLDLNLPQKLIDRGFFKLEGKPDLFFRYCYGQKPGPNAWPYSFVDAEDHMAELRRKKTGPSDFQDKTKFDSSKYSYEQFVD